MKILTIDGGGIWGVGVASAIAKWEDIFKVKFCDEFDAFCGTSTGSILATCLACGMSGQEIVDIYKKRMNEIFEKPPLWWKLSPWRPKYDGKGLKRVLKDVFKDKQFKDLQKLLFVTASDSAGDKKNKVFDTHGDHFTDLAYAVLCSASAPTYFPPVDGHFMDGGLWSNNPALVGLTGVIRVTGQKDGHQVFSIGTNGMNPNGRKIPARMTLIDWSKYLMGDFMFTGGESAVSFYMERLVEGQYIRVEPIVSQTIELDDLKAVPQILEIWDREAINTANQIKNFIERFKEC